MKILLKDCQLEKGLSNLLIEKQKIAYVGNEEVSCDQEIDLQGKLVIPGIIDPHVHVRDLEQAYKEDWISASRSAMAGGITTLFDMPNTLPPTTSLHNLDLKRKEAEKSFVHCKFFIGATAHNIFDIEAILKDNPGDVAGIKIYLAATSSNELVDDPEILKKILTLAKKYDKIVAVHSEDQKCIEAWQKKYPQNDPHFHNLIRNRECAIRSTQMILALSAEVGNKLYLVHTSLAEEMELVKTYKKTIPLFCEVTPHHLLLNEGHIDKVGNFGKVNPPLRTASDNKALWQALSEGVVDTIGSDHAPHNLDEKKLPYKEAPSGFPGLETSLPLMLNEINKGNLTLEMLIQLMAKNPARIFEVPQRGEIKEGFIADLVIIDMHQGWTIDASKFKTKAKYSPFDGMEIQGKVVQTFVEGKQAYIA